MNFIYCMLSSISADHKEQQIVNGRQRITTFETGHETRVDESHVADGFNVVYTDYRPTVFPFLWGILSPHLKR